MRAIKILVILTGLAILFLAPGRAGANVLTFTPQPYLDDVQFYWGSNGSGPSSWSPGYGPPPTSYDNNQWHSYIALQGDNNFTISSAVYNSGSGLLTITTGFGGASGLGSSFSEDGAIAANLTLISKGGQTYMVALNTASGSYFGSSYANYLGKVYQITLTGNLSGNSGYATSYDLYNGSGYGYGAKYNYNNPTPVPVLATGSPISNLGTNPADVIWTGPSGGDMVITLNLKDLATALSGQGLTFNANNFQFIYPAATCANGVLAGDVPICSPLLLLGSGLLGLGGLRWKWSHKT